MVSAEDAQPNEIRLARKGSTNVPAIRSACPPIVRGSWRGRGRGRGQGQGQGQGRGQGRGRGQGLGRGTSFPSQAKSQSGSVWESTAHSTSPTQGASSGPQVFNSRGQQQKRPSSAQDTGRYWKRPRLDPSLSQLTDDTTIASAPLVKSRSGLRKSDRKTLGDITTVSVELPVDYRKGAPLSQSRRRGWIRQQVRNLEHDKGCKVIGYSFHESFVRFTCGQPAFQRGTCPPDSAGDSGLPFQVDTQSDDCKRCIVPDDRSDDPSAMSAVEDMLNEKPGPLGSFEDTNAPAPWIESMPRHLGRFSASDTYDPNSKEVKAALTISNNPRILKPSFTKIVNNAEALHTPVSNPNSDVPSSFAQRSNMPHAEEGMSPVPYVSCDGGLTTKGDAHSDQRLEPKQSERKFYPSFRSGTLVVLPPKDFVLSSPAATGSTLPNSPKRISPSSLADTVRSVPYDSMDFLPVHGPVLDRAASSLSGEDVIEADVEPIAYQRHPVHDTTVDARDPVLLSTTNAGGLREAPEEHSVHTRSSMCQSIRVDAQNELIHFPRESYDKPRRLLVSPILGVLSITMRGFIDHTERSPPRRAHPLRSAIDPTGQSVDDACLLRSSNSGFVLLAHARDTQELSLIRVKKEKVSELSTFHRPMQGERKGGVSAVCSMMSPLMFASGGYDHRVHLWDATKDVTRPSPSFLSIKHTALVQSLLPIRDTSHKLVTAGADCSVHIWDLSAERVVNSLKTSNSVYHVHEALSPFCTLLEVAHRELQFEIRDHRLVPKQPVQRFGYHTPKVHGRYMKGDMSSTMFACGGRDGSVRMWDLRNVASPQIFPCFPDRRVTQIVFDDGQLVACSEDHDIAFVRHARNL